ncbi:MAG: hypothetical protein M1814_001427 [Vezdaea aestivalis]|nr:MAG: hypothetical protein M1814_001427 [Vezdaea aestivalis]
MLEAVPPQQEAVSAEAATANPSQGKRKNNNQKLYGNPLPLETFPIPSFIPSNPLSILQVLYTFLSQTLFPPSSHPSYLYKGYFSEETRSIHITDERTARTLWEKGFFGKGSLSRSEPTWLDGEKRRRGLVAAQTSEEVTSKRREERRRFKLERAKKEQEVIEQRLEAEKKAKALEGAPNYGTSSALQGASDGHTGPSDSDTIVTEQVGMDDSISAASTTVKEKSIDDLAVSPDITQTQVDNTPIFNEEHLQLEPNEAFFLAFALGVLQIFLSAGNQPLSILDLLTIFRRQSTFPPLSSTAPLLPDDLFLTSYAAYHHFRSLGWVVRSGIKFGVDMLLYNRGPVFAHAEFAVVVLPDYSRWKDEDESEGRKRQRERRPWWWLHCVNRVQTQVRKSTVLAYVEIPSIEEVKALQEKGDVKGLIGRYKVREVGLKRWLPNRSR